MSNLIVALDVPGRTQADAFVTRLGEVDCWLKIGLELFSGEGPNLVRDYCNAGRRIFVDLKLHDIPATVGRATGRIANLGAGLLTVHAAGGLAMMRAACDAAKAADGSQLRILAITVLTSLDRDDLHRVGIAAQNIEELVVQRALLAVEAGCDGVVASPREASALRAVLPEDFVIVTPGIRSAGADQPDDQKRTMTAAEARRAGADMIVVGRPIRDASEPAVAAQRFAEEFGV